MDIISELIPDAYVGVLPRHTFGLAALFASFKLFFLNEYALILHHTLKHT